MPGFVGAVQIVNISSGGVVNIGDVFQIQPLTKSKTFAGAGSFNTGDTIRLQNHQSSTNTLDPDAMDQATYLNF